MTCRWDRDAQAHLTREHLPECIDTTCKGCRPCTHEDGNPVRHCRTRLRCTSHLDWHEHTCATCLGKIRTNMHRLLDALALMPEEAIEQGINSEPANLAGPHADFVSAGWRLVNQGVPGDKVRDELDMLDPYTCLTYHERVIREEMNHDAQTLVSPTIAASAGYLSWVLTDLARDPDQVPVLAELIRETGRLADHAEAVLHDSRKPERGAPCRSCAKPAPRLRLERAHYCTDPDCTRIHVADDSADRWVCPADRDHAWSTAEYRRWVYADAHDAKMREVPAG